MTAASNVTIRDARQDTADAREVAWALETATDDLFSQLIGGTWQDVLSDLNSLPGHAWSCAQARIAEVNGETQGARVGRGSSVVSSSTG